MPADAGAADARSRLARLAPLAIIILVPPRPALLPWTPPVRSRRIARPRIVALVLSRADHGSAADARSRLARIARRANIGVVTRRPVRLRRIRAKSGWINGRSLVA